MIKIYLNAEHGGADAGAVYGTIFEKTLNLKVSAFCAEALSQYDCEVIQSRTTDKGLLIADRLTHVEKENPNICITIAHNAGGGDGCEIFYRPGDIISSKSYDFAKKLEANYKKIGQNSRGIKTSTDSSYNFAMCREPSRMGIISVLSEFAFLDNTNDRLLIDSDEDLRKEASAIAYSLIEFFNISKKEDPSKPDVTTPLYRVGTGWSNGKCVGQKGAFAVYDYAVNFAKTLKYPYKVFDCNGNVKFTNEKIPKAKDAVKLQRAKLYSSSTSTKVANVLTGTYYIYDGININGRYRITNNIKYCGKKPTGLFTTGYIDAKDVK